jgi:hypothetical protein
MLATEIAKVREEIVLKKSRKRNLKHRKRRNYT